MTGYPAVKQRGHTEGMFSAPIQSPICLASMPQCRSDRKCSFGQIYTAGRSIMSWMLLLRLHHQIAAHVVSPMQMCMSCQHHDRWFFSRLCRAFAWQSTGETLSANGLHRILICYECSKRSVSTTNRLIRCRPKCYGSLQCSGAQFSYPDLHWSQPATAKEDQDTMRNGSTA